MNKPNLRDPLQLLAFGFGSGLAPKAPGTFGSLAALVLFPLLALLTLPAYLVVVLLASLAGIAICDHAAKALQVHDDGRIVWDEFAGQWIALIPLVPVLHWDGASVLWLLVGFGLFRLFDIAKPWPIGYLDRKVHGGLGIMVDDLAAGAIAGACLYALRMLFNA
ncbi:MAG: phosphatidylglycerophosphatase A [Moraxellaceae bacterium]|nr:phosphatidylglycerophosphatase A [Moraxellaceae bacterium]MBP9731516.1 phosphatidylglycerophosphatase A [Moraxellaceae bacterium]